MKKIVLPLLATLTVLLLGACSIISDLIPAQEVEVLQLNEIEATTSLTTEEPVSAESFFSGESSGELRSQALVAGEYNIPISVYRSGDDLEGDVFNLGATLTQEITLSTLKLESATPTVFPDEIKAQFKLPYLQVWDGFVAPEQYAYFPWLPEERQNEMKASFTSAFSKGLVSITQSGEFFDNAFIDAFIDKGADEDDLDRFSFTYKKDSANCTDKSCVYKQALNVVTEDSYENCRQRAVWPDVVCREVGVSQFHYLSIHMNSEKLGEIKKIFTEGEKQNSVFLAIWLNVKSATDTPIPAGLSATTTLFAPPAKVKAEF